MVLRADGEQVPDTNAEVFHHLERNGHLEPDTAEDMSRAAGLRNVLAHRYRTAIDDEDVYNALENELPVFRDFLAQVREAVE